jgi:ABC-type sugar transport system ATPase subunit
VARIRFDRVTKRYGNVFAVDALDLDICDREFLVLLGPSGCGKTTTLNMIAGLEELSAGDIYFDDEIVTFVPPHRRDVAMVFQSYALYPHKTVRDNIAFGLKMRGHPAAEIEQRVRDRRLIRSHQRAASSAVSRCTRLGLAKRADGERQLPHHDERVVEFSPCVSRSNG